MISSYSTIFQLGHRGLEGLWDGDIIAQEKIDGSQISFGLIDGVLHIRSKGQAIDPDAPDGMFALGVIEIVARLDSLHPSWVYRGEYLQKPKHNALAYDRIPKDHIVLFDVDRGHEDYLMPGDLEREANAVGFESAPLIFDGSGDAIDLAVCLPVYLQQNSFLGGQKIEGVVFKAYGRFGTDKKTLMGKYVSEAFKEVHKQAWAGQGHDGILQKLIKEYRTPARWNKAVLHLAERGELQDAPQDIGPLLKEINEDVLRECRDDIKDELFKFFWKDITRGLTRGFPEYYKAKLAGIAWEGEDDAVGAQTRANREDGRLGSVFLPGQEESGL